MSEDKKTTEEVKNKKEIQNDEAQVKYAKNAKNDDKKKEEKQEEAKNKNPLGLEDLPDEIKKKIEKKQAEQNAKTKKSKVRKKKKKKTERKATVGKAFVKATYNNTIVTLTDLQGNVLSWASAGIAGFKGPKKATPYAASIITRIAVGKAREDYGLEEVSVFVKGVGTGRESAIRSLNSNGLNVGLIKDITPIPHNGCRPRKPRRV